MLRRERLRAATLNFRDLVQRRLRDEQNVELAESSRRDGLHRRDAEIPVRHLLLGWTLRKGICDSQRVRRAKFNQQFPVRAMFEVGNVRLKNKIAQHVLLSRKGTVQSGVEIAKDNLQSIDRTLLVRGLQLLKELLSLIERPAGVRSVGGDNGCLAATPCLTSSKPTGWTTG